MTFVELFLSSCSSVRLFCLALRAVWAAVGQVVWSPLGSATDATTAGREGPSAGRAHARTSLHMWRLVTSSTYLNCTGLGNSRRLGDTLHLGRAVAARRARADQQPVTPSQTPRPNWTGETCLVLPHTPPQPALHLSQSRYRVT